MENTIFNEPLGKNARFRCTSEFKHIKTWIPWFFSITGSFQIVVFQSYSHIFSCLDSFFYVTAMSPMPLTTGPETSTCSFILKNDWFKNSNFGTGIPCWNYLEFCCCHSFLWCSLHHSPSRFGQPNTSFLLSKPIRMLSLYCNRAIIGFSFLLWHLF